MTWDGKRAVSFHGAQDGERKKTGERREEGSNTGYGKDGSNSWHFASLGNNSSALTEWSWFDHNLVGLVIWSWLIARGGGGG
jgi:hypothetical protein